MSYADDKTRGTTNEVVGKVKQAAGDLTDNDDLKAEGDTQELKGNAQNAIGDAKQAVGNALHNAANAVKGSGD